MHQKYLADKLFNTEKYNTKPDEAGRIFGTSNFMNGFNSNMPFLTHQTASFEITGRISDEDAKYLYEFQQVLPRKRYLILCHFLFLKRSCKKKL